MFAWLPAPLFLAIMKELDDPVSLKYLIQASPRAASLFSECHLEITEAVMTNSLCPQLLHSAFTVAGLHHFDIPKESGRRKQVAQAPLGMYSKTGVPNRFWLSTDTRQLARHNAQGEGARSAGPVLERYGHPRPRAKARYPYQLHALLLHRVSSTLACLPDTESSSADAELEQVREGVQVNPVHVRIELIVIESH